MSRTCSSCDRGLRRGAARRAWVLESSGAIKYGLVCARCALRSVVLVPPPPAVTPVACSGCKSAPAAFCAGCFERSAAAVRELTAANVVLATRSAVP